MSMVIMEIMRSFCARLAYSIMLSFVLLLLELPARPGGLCSRQALHVGNTHVPQWYHFGGAAQALGPPDFLDSRHVSERPGHRIGPELPDVCWLPSLFKKSSKPHVAVQIHSPLKSGRFTGTNSWEIIATMDFFDLGASNEANPGKPLWRNMDVC